jgi:hypothetical protein
MSQKDVQNHVERTRAELEATLSEIEHRVSPAELSKQALGWVTGSYDRNPTRWLIGGGIAVVAGVAAVLWAIFGDDD